MSNLPANPLADFVKEAEAHMRDPAGPIGGFLQFNSNSGRWTFGQDQEDVDGAKALINSASMEHGYIRWGGDSPAKAFSRVNQAYPEKPEPVDGTDRDGNEKTFHAQEARQVTGKFIGDDADLEQFVFNTSSMAGVENTAKLFRDILVKAKDSPYCFPVVELTSDSYIHSTRKNRIYKPVWKIVEWCDLDGNPETAKITDESPTTEEAETEPEQPRRRRRRQA